MVMLKADEVEVQQSRYHDDDGDETLSYFYFTSAFAYKKIPMGRSLVFILDP